MDRADQPKPSTLDPPLAYCFLACCFGAFNSFALYSEVIKSGLEVSGGLYVFWVFVSIAALAFAVWKKHFLFIASPALFLLYTFLNCVLTPDNLVVRTMDAATICGIVFGIVYALLNAGLLFYLSRLKEVKEKGKISH